MKRFSHDAYGPLFGSTEPNIEHSEDEVIATNSKESKYSSFRIILLAATLIISGLLLLKVLT